eukprot:SAG31_NODE_9028_length_1345_cov_2.135634_1_plen_92_part_00
MADELSVDGDVYTTENPYGGDDGEDDLELPANEDKTQGATARASASEKNVAVAGGICCAIIFIAIVGAMIWMLAVSQTSRRAACFCLLLFA